MIKIIHLSQSDYDGGAARAAYRIINSLNENSDIECILRVNRKITNNKKVIESSFKRRFFNHLNCYMSIKIQNLQKTNNSILHSLSLFPSYFDKELNKSLADIVHLHWVQGEMISIEEISRIKKPIIWTLHDSWPFCGSEHHPNGLYDRRFIDGYRRDNRNKNDQGLDLNRWTWERKYKNWKTPITIVSPSSWLASCAKQSKLMHNWQVKVIPHPLDLNTFRPYHKELSRKNFALPLKKILILFGSLNKFDNELKGWKILEKTIYSISQIFPEASIVIFGCVKPKNIPKLKLNLVFVGRIIDDNLLASLYSAVDLIVSPSKVESFGQTISEAQACGTPALAFKSTGLMDVIEHGKTGFLAEPYNIKSFAKGIEWILSDKERYKKLSSNSRKRALKLWSNKIISKKYKDLYLEILNK